MRLRAKIYQLKRRGLLVTVAIFLIVFCIWLVLRPVSKINSYPILIVNFPSPNLRLLPYRYWNHRDMFPERYTDNTCMELPAITDLQYAASFWQLLLVGNGSVYVYGAYYDDRFREPLVRILVYADVAPLPKLYCQLWFPNDNEPQTELAVPMYGWNPSWGGGPTNRVNEPYILGCKCRRHIPEVNIPPVAAAVVSAPCGVATNALDIQQAPFHDQLHPKPAVRRSRHNGTKVAVCLKWLHYRQDVSVQVAEWMQLMKHFGAERVYVYIVRVHPNTRKVLKYYEDEGFIVVSELSHAPQVSGYQKYIPLREYRRELLSLNDCLYRSIGHYDWITSLDLDEIIVPPSGSTWAEMIDNETTVAAAQHPGRRFDSLVFPNYYVLDGAQKDLMAPAKTRMLAHTWRSRSHSPRGCAVKSFFKVSSVTAMHNHRPLTCKESLRGCRDRYVYGPGRMLHYREKCRFDQKDCKELHDVVREKLLDRWRGPVLEEVQGVLEKLGLEGLY